jgi:heptosyltransferase-2
VTTSLVVQTSFLGDMVLTTPLLAYLAERGTVDVVCTPAAAALLANNPCAREIIVYDKRGADRGLRGLVRFARRLRATGYDAAYHAQASARSGALTWLARIPRRVGFATAAGRAFYTTSVAPLDNVHHAARLLSLGTGDPARTATRAELRPRLYPGPTERFAVDALLAEARVGATDIMIALAPGSVWATKRWPYYSELAQRLSSRARIVVVGAAADAPLARDILAAAPNAIDATGRLSLLASAELIGRAALLVTNDSAPLHLASGMNTPTLAIFGPTVPEFGFGPLAEVSVVAGRAALPCRPCDRHGPQRCPLGHWKCMREMTAAEIAGIVDDIQAGRA